MKIILRFFTLGFFLVLVPACATKGGSATAYAEIDPSFASAQPHRAGIRIYRKESYACSEALVRVLIDGDHAANLGPGATLTLYAAPGVHLVSVSPNARCPSESAQQYVTIAEGRTQALVTRFDLFSHISLATPDRADLQ